MAPTGIEVRDNSEKALQAILDGVADGLEEVADRIVELAIQDVPVGDSGNLQRGIGRDPVKRTKTSASVRFGVFGVPYAASVEWGSAGRGEPLGSTYQSPAGGDGVTWPRIPPGKKRWGPYPIRARNAPYLVFKVRNEETGELVWVRKKEVIHPGVEARPYMRPAIDVVLAREFGPIMTRAVQRRLRAALGPPPRN